jgi:hypothetical protein
MTESAFDAGGLFDDDYLYFFANPLEERSGAETDLIWNLLDLQPDGGPDLSGRYLGRTEPAIAVRPALRHLARAMG